VSYDAFARRGVKLNLTRGKPASAQLDLCHQLLSLPGPGDFMSGTIDCRNYGELAGLPELRALLAPVFGVTPDRAIIGEKRESLVDARLRRVLDAEGQLRQRVSVVEAITHCVPVSSAWLRSSFLHLPGIRYRNDYGAADRYRSGHGRVEKLVAADPQIKGMWCVPKYSNPSGAVYSSETIERLAKMKTAARDFRLFWDNAYAVHHLTAERIEIASIDAECAKHGNPNRAFIFGSTSKVTFAGAVWACSRVRRRT